MRTRAMSEKIEIDITSDTVCPWCYIGKRRLERAIEQMQVLNAVIERCDCEYLSNSMVA